MNITPDLKIKIEKLDTFDKLMIYMDYFIGESIRNKDFHIIHQSEKKQYIRNYIFKDFGKSLSTAKPNLFLDCCNDNFPLKRLMSFAEFTNTTNYNSFINDSKKFAGEPNVIFQMKGIYKWISLYVENYKELLK